MKATLIYYLELYLLFAPNAYYVPAFKTGNLAVILFCITLNIIAVKEACYIVDLIKELIFRKPSR